MRVCCVGVVDVSCACCLREAVLSFWLCFESGVSLWCVYSLWTWVFCCFCVRFSPNFVKVCVCVSIVQGD